MSNKYPQSRCFREGKTDSRTVAEERTFCSESRRSPVRKAKRSREESTSSESRSESERRVPSSSKKRRKEDRKRRKRKYSRSSSESKQVYNSSSDESDSSASKRRKSKHKKEKKKRKKRKNEKKKATKKQKSKKKSKVKEQADDAGHTKEASGTNENRSAKGNVSRVMPIETGDTAPTKQRTMAPMTKEEYEKRQSQIRRVYDPETGRNRLIRGDGEILEEIVSMERHKAINKAATHGDGAFFQASLGLSQR